MVSISNAQVALSLFPSSAGSIDYASLFSGGSGSTGAAYNAGTVHVAISQAEKNEAKQLAQVAKDPIVQRDLARYKKVVASAKSMEDVLDDPVARQVFMKANGLGADVNNVGLAKKALMSDPYASDGLAFKLASVNGTWLSTVRAYNTNLLGVGVLQTSDAIKEVSDNYVAEKRLDMLDQQLPGLGTALLFKKQASTFDETIKILGSKLGREVVTTALGIPREIAIQSLNAQEKAINSRLKIENLQKPDFVDKLAQRYLLAYNGVLGGISV